MSLQKNITFIQYYKKKNIFFFNRYTSFNIEYSLELNKLTKTKLYSQLNNLKKTLNTRKAKQN